MNRPALGLMLALLVFGTRPASGDDPIASALQDRIVDARQSLNDARAFVGARLPAIPAAGSAGEWAKIAEALRARVWNEVIFRGEAASWRDAATRVEWLDTIDGGPGYHIRKLRIEALPGLWVPALLYEPDVIRGKVPVVLNVNGHDSKGKAADYKQVRCINLAKQGMLALNLEWFGMGQLATPGFQHGLINAIDLCGSGGIATHFLAMRRGLDVLLAHEHADVERVAVTGLSGGGWQTIFFSSLEPRVTMTVPVAGYSSYQTRIQYLEDLGDSEQTPCDLGTVVDYAHLTAMMAPRPALLIFNAKDNCCFAAPHALPPLRDAAAPVYRLFDRAGNLRAHVNFDPGDHNYAADNRRAFYQMIADNWSRPGQIYTAQEVPSESELKSVADLAVELPSDNLDFQRLALKLAERLPVPAAADSEARRLRLRSIVRPVSAESTVETLSDQDHEGVRVERLKLRVGGAWSVPVVRLTPKSAVETVILLADEGRSSTGEVVRKFVEERKQVVAVDPYYFGEGAVADHAYLWSLMIGTVGERPLGVQVGEVLAAARASRSPDSPLPTALVAIGPRTGLVALIAAALEPEAVQSVEVRRPLGSLKELLEEGRTYDKSPELFCFGLLRDFDVKDLAALVAPRPVRAVEASERARAELGAIATGP